MKWPKREAERRRIEGALRKYSAEVRALRGIVDERALNALSMQFVASLRREDYYRLLQRMPITARRANPNDPIFDAERAVAHHMQNGNIEEAAWLIFLMTHFARPADTGWLRLKDVYGRLGEGLWDWQTVSADPAAFKDWILANWTNIRGKFGNHRKYESLRPTSHRNMGRVLDSYLAWIGDKGHRPFFAAAVRSVGNDPQKVFDALYVAMEIVSFGRLAKFDYLSLLGRYNVAPVRAGSAYLDGATGPAKGARLLIDGNRDSATSTAQLQLILTDLDQYLQVGMEVMEDSLCNWQKNPSRFEHFRG